MKNKGLGEVKNVNEVIENVFDLAQRVEDEKVPIARAKAINELLKSGIDYMKAQMVYAEMQNRGTAPDIPFLEAATNKKLLKKLEITDKKK